MDKRGMNVPEASSGRGMGFLAGLGKLVTDHFSGERERMLSQQKNIDRRALDLVTKAAGYDIEREAAIAVAPLMKNENLSKIGSIEKQKEAKIYNITEKPDTKDKSGTPRTKKPQSGQPTTEDTGPTSSTSGMKEPKIKKQTATTRASSGRTKRPYVTKAEVTAAVKGGHIQEAEGLGLNKAYDSMVARREDSAGKMDTTPKVKKTSTKPKKPTMPKANGTSTSTNGNKKGGM
jgi:hypothetical protein